MAHNGTTFDKPFCVAAYSRVGRVIPNKPWLDTRTDIKYPEHITTRNLRHLASEHSFLNPFAHRAVFDVLTMLKVASHYDIQAIVSRASEPTVYVQALVSFDDRDKAKARGYLWCGPKRIWWRGFKQSEYAAEKGSCGFQTTVLPGSPE
jgi:DNA polymerase-3 subunit epsilon